MQNVLYGQKECHYHKKKYIIMFLCLLRRKNVKMHTKYRIWENEKTLRETLISRMSVFKFLR